MHSIIRLSAAADLLIVTGMLVASPAVSAPPEIMMARRRDRAHTKLNTGAKNIAAKYEGQRTDGSHAVNGTAYVQNKTAAFQFYFDKKGIKIDRFVVNKTQGSGNAGSNASSSSSMPSGDQQACLAVVSNKANNGDVTVPATED